MAVGDIVFMRIPVDIDPDAQPDSLIQLLTTGGLFPVANFDIISVNVVVDLGKGGDRQVAVVMAREIL